MGLKITSNRFRRLPAKRLARPKLVRGVRAPKPRSVKSRRLSTHFLTPTRQVSRLWRSHSVHVDRGLHASKGNESHEVTPLPESESRFKWTFSEFKEQIKQPRKKGPSGPPPPKPPNFEVEINLRNQSYRLVRVPGKTFMAGDKEIGIEEHQETVGDLLFNQTPITYGQYVSLLGKRTQYGIVGRHEVTGQIHVLSRGIKIEKPNDPNRFHAIEEGIIPEGRVVWNGGYYHFKRIKTFSEVPILRRNLEVWNQVVELAPSRARYQQMVANLQKKEFSKEDHPAVLISLWDMVDWFQKFNERTEEIRRELGIGPLRPPIEWEWEAAAKGPDGKNKYGTSTGELNPELAHYNTQATAPVNAYPGILYGAQELLGMAGNVWQRVIGYRDGWNWFNVSDLRGGSWNGNYPGYWRAAYRFNIFDPGSRDDANFGFRGASAPQGSLKKWSQKLLNRNPGF